MKSECSERVLMHFSRLASSFNARGSSCAFWQKKFNSSGTWKKLHGLSKRRNQYAPDSTGNASHATKTSPLAECAANHKGWFVLVLHIPEMGPQWEATAPCCNLSAGQVSPRNCL
ncbi:Hypothetical predicted protein [Podarcis lilfordi]|uniref:Uncharacterized protein n=1 Tax=Podarcis lilfordi TaxID=74358 RepID=A0AA35LER6_9SAUR|nr:Hypothetical predicted protein [Podarcis lilfordi]